MVRMKRFACLALSASLLVSSVCMDTGAADAVNPAELQVASEEVAEDAAEAVDAEGAEVKEEAEAPAQEEVAPEEEKKSEEVADADDAEVKEEDAAEETAEGDEADVADEDAEAVLDEEAGELEAATVYTKAAIKAELNASNTELTVDWSAVDAANTLKPIWYVVTVNDKAIPVSNSSGNEKQIKIPADGTVMNKAFAYKVKVYARDVGYMETAYDVVGGLNVLKSFNSGDSSNQEVSIAEIKALYNLEKPVYDISGSTASGNASSMTVTVNMNKIPGATEYIFTRSDGKVDTLKDSDLPTGPIAKAISSVALDQVYTYSLKVTDGTNEVVLADAGTVDTKKPAAVTNLNGIVLAGQMELSWSPVTNVSDLQTYQIYDVASGRRVDSPGAASTSYRIIQGKTTGNSYTFSGAYGIYSYRVRSYRPTPGVKSYASMTSAEKEAHRIYSDDVIVKVNYADPKTSVQTMSFKATVKSTCRGFYNSKTMKVKGKVKKGTKVTCYESYSNRYRCVLPNGKELWINKAKLNLTGYKYKGWEKGQYENNVLESFVNNGGYSSKTPYLIWINQYTQRVAIFTGSQGNWKLERHVKCATGQYSARTPTGTFKIYKKEKGWFYKTTYEAPIVLFYKRNAFHSRIKSNRKSNRGKVVDGRIGKPVSHGCIRMYDKDLQFIYSLPKGTTVISY